jgi:hypothetical protein
VLFVPLRYYLRVHWHPGSILPLKNKYRQAVLGLFDGEIGIYAKVTPKGTARFLKIKKMTDQKYLKDEIPVAEE